MRILILRWEIIIYKAEAEAEAEARVSSVGECNEI